MAKDGLFGKTLPVLTGNMLNMKDDPVTRPMLLNAQQQMNAINQYNSMVAQSQQNMYNIGGGLYTNIYTNNTDQYTKKLDERPPVYNPFQPLDVSGDQEMADNKTPRAPIVLTPIGVLAFNNLYTARPVVEGGEPRFSAALIFDETAQKTEAFQSLSKAIMTEAHRFFGEKLPKNLRWPMRDGEEKEDYEGFGEGKKFIVPWTKTKLGVVGPKREEMMESDVFSGVTARMAVRPFGYNKGGNAGVGLVIEGVQVADVNRPRIDGKAANPSKLFDELESADEDALPF